jgi:PAS domain S-box-containing protein
MRNSVSIKSKPVKKYPEDYQIPVSFDKNKVVAPDEKLKESEIRYRRLFETAKDGILILDFETGNITDANPYIIQIIDYPLKEIIGKKLWEIGLFSNKEESELAFTDLKTNGYIRFEDMPIQKRNGKITEVEFICNVYSANNTKVIQCNIRDITERKQADETFQNEEKEKRAAQLIIANKELAFQNDEKEKRATELIIVNKELAFQNEEKEKRAAELIIANKELAFQNEEKEKRATELILANKELEAFSYSVSHDLRAPLRHIGGFVDLLIKNSSSQLDETGLRYLNIISESSHEMGNLIDALLTFSRLNRAELQRTKINSKNMVTRVIKTFSDELAGRIIEINIPELPDVMGDEKLMNQVWVNLISNAIKYTRNKEKAVIDFGGKIENDQTIFYIRDNGAGFDMKYADKLFGVFQRLHKARDFEGIGIGLANVKRIVMRHSGKCWAISEADKGATFFFSVPNN